MATKKQKQELVDALKFTPTTYRLLIQGYGGECYAGRVDRKIYEYFKAQKIDIEEYASGYDEFEGMPKEMMPFTPGAPFECDNIFHASGAELTEMNSIELFNENGDVHWECTAGLNDLEDAGVVVEEFSNEDFDDLEDGSVVFWGGQGEKGCFFDGEIYLTAPFDPKKLVIKYETCDGWCIINYVEYDGEDVDGSGGYSTTGKWAENKFIIGGDEEVYTDTVCAEDREDAGLTWDTMPESACTSETTENDVECVQCEWKGLVDETNDWDGAMACPECGEPVEFINKDWDPVAELDKIVAPYQLTEWYDKDVQPHHKGEYEVVYDAAWPNSGMGMAEWTGRSWKQNGKKLAILKWRGLTESVK